MPNWCENDLFVTSKIDEDPVINQFIICSMSSGRLLDFNKFIPMPKFLEVESTFRPTPEQQKIYIENQKKYGCKTWHDWIWDGWGTKWNAVDVCFSTHYLTRKYQPFIKNGLLVKFQTAWSPPKPVIKVMSGRFPTLKFALRYYEMGQSYKGRFACQNGKIICDRQEPYHGNRGG